MCMFQKFEKLVDNAMNLVQDESLRDIFGKKKEVEISKFDSIREEMDNSQYNDIDELTLFRTKL